MTLQRYSAKYENSWAVVIGINKYQHFGPLDHARNDAMAFANCLKTRFAFPDGNTLLLLDQDASQKNIQAAMHRLNRVTSANDRVLVYYAGHGHTIPAYHRDIGFVVPVEGDPEDTSTLLPWDDLFNTSRSIPAKHVLFIMDACYGGLFGQRGRAPGSKRFVRDMLCRYSRQFLTAGKADQTVADSGGPRLGHSVFSGHLLDALEGGLQAKDGVVSANALMAHVYDRVAKDAHSLQDPHFGFLAGDGDFFFSVPDLEDDSDASTPASDILVEISPSLIAPEEVEVTPPLLEQVKEYLSDRKYRIQLDDLVKRELRAVQKRLGEDNFPTQSHGVSTEDFASRLAKYEETMQELLGVVALLGRWAEGEQLIAIRQIMDSLAGNIESKGGVTLWLYLRYYPALLAMYVGGIAALDAGNYSSLKALFEVNARDEHTDTEGTVLQAVSHLVSRTDPAFKKLPGHEQNYAPQSEYLFKRVQPFVEDMLYLGNRYEGQFDRFEILSALCTADLDDDSWGRVGRFGWKYRSRRGSRNPFTALIEEAKREEDNWAPLKAGLFHGSHKRFAEIAERFKSQLLDKLNWF